MNFLPLEEAHSALSAKQKELETKRREWLERQTPEFQELQRADKAAVEKQWNLMFVVLLALVCFVINAVISLSVFFALELTVYTDKIHEATQATRAIRALASMFIAPVLSVAIAFFHNLKYQNSSPNHTRLILVNHPDHAIWSERDQDLGSRLRDVNLKMKRLTQRGLLYVDGERPADPAAVLGTLYVNGERVADLTYDQMPYEFHLDEIILPVSVKLGDEVLFEQMASFRRIYVLTLDLTTDESGTLAVEAQNMVRKTYDEERAKMTRRGTVYVAE